VATLPILEFPDPRLRTKARPVTQFDAALKSLIADMFETMYAAPGIGLAATQINVHLRLLVADVSESKDSPVVVINPKITHTVGSKVYEEGCLSVPGFCAKVERADVITLSAQDADGAPFELTADGLLAVCLQHEMDHLDGKLFVDYLSPIKRALLKKRMAKLERERLKPEPA
jgi:peptide deformylase